MAGPISGVTRLKTCVAAKKVDRITTRPLRFSSGVRDALISCSGASTRPRTSTPNSIIPSTSANSGGGTNVTRSADSQSAEQRYRQKQQRQIDGFGGSLHLRFLNTRIGLKSDASTRSPSASSARSSSALCM